ncbi:ankyrin repeat-containing domain protein [Suillus paluster]|uniref:ankyrin repeat-containing domain protein n=1 Tax=Suillus paluster TaxID=48578 RepID=UPI001B8747DA|nr:ankyrin repeat-containing domain protein [Suillus paluster]KAG1723030.1 ankyrin repeat-containing domain protein [Suillus paluster]
MATWNIVGEIANVGGITSIVQLSLQVIIAVKSYTSSVAGAEAARMSLHNELLSINKTLNEIFVLVQQSNSGTSMTKIDSFPLDSALKECEETLRALRDRIPERKFQKWFDLRQTSRSTWPFQQADIMNAVGKLERCKSTLLVTISGGLLSTTREIQHDMKDEGVKIRKEVTHRTGEVTNEIKQKIEEDSGAIKGEITGAKQAIVNMVNDVVGRIIVMQESAKKEHLARLALKQQEQLLQWLAGFDCTVKHEFVSTQRQENTCTWVFETEAFREWRTPPTVQRTSVLWINGKPGAGKTVIASAIINELMVHGETLVYFYCDFRQERTTDGAIVLRSLLVQLLRKVPMEWNSEFFDLFCRKSQGAEAPTNIDILCGLVSRALRLLRRPIAIIDALDECRCDETFLTRLVSTANEGDLRLLITSRPEQAISVALSDLPSLSLSEYVRSIKNDMELHIGKEVEARSRLASLATDLKYEIRNSLLQQADGMFSWVQCQLDAISACRSVKGISDSLKRLPKGLYETYDRILLEIQEAGPDRSSIVERTLMWLVAALEPLHLSQLAEALSIEIGSTTLNQELSVMCPTDLLEICSSLVSFDKRTGVVTLSHYSVREYLMAGEKAQKYRHLLEDAHRYIAQHCTQYLITDDVLDSTQTRPLLRYALDHGLGAHISSIIIEEDSVLSCLENLPRHMCIRYPWNSRVAYSNPWQIWLADPQSICDIVIHFGPEWMIQRYLREHREYWNHVLQFAIMGGWTQLANVVLGLGRDVNLSITIDLETTTPVMFALRHSPRELLECFLSRGARLSVDAIHNALEDRQDVDSNLISSLIQNGADVRATHPSFQDSPLHTLFRKSAQSQEVYLDVTRALVVAGCEYRTRDLAGLMPLDIVAVNSLHTVTDYLLQLYAADGAENEPLYLAIKRQSFSYVEYLIGRGAYIPADAIHVALQSTQIYMSRVVASLVQHGADINAIHLGASPLHILLDHWTSGNDCLETAYILVEAGCSLDETDEAGNTPLHLAIRRQSLPFVEYLIKKGARIPGDAIHVAIHPAEVNLNPNDISTVIYDDADDNALHLLEHVADADVSSPPLTTLGNRSSFPFRYWSHDSNCLEIVRVLIDAGCEQDAVDSAGYSPLDLAITQSLPCVTQYFLQMGKPVHVNHPVHVALNSDVPTPCINPDIRPGQEQWVEQLYAWQTDCRFQTMRALIEAGHDATSRYSAGQTLLGIAIQRRIPSAVNYLLGKLACGQLDSFCGSGLEEHNAEVIMALLQNSTPLHALMRNVVTGPVGIHDFCFSSRGIRGPFCERDCGEILLILIDEGFLVNTEDSSGNTPLRIAIQRRLFLVIDYLLRRDPICDVGDVLAAFGTQSHVWKRLLQKYVLNVDPLHTLISQMQWDHVVDGDANLAIMKSLVQAGCDVNARDSNGITPLQYMCKLEVDRRYPAVTDFLCKEGAL